MTETKKYVPELYKKYKEVVIPSLIKSQGYKNINEAPRLEKIVINAGLGDVKDNTKSFNKAVEELAIISGQKPKIIAAKKSVANFKLREGMNVSAKVTLRGYKMYEFLARLISVALPRVRDFEGLNPKSFDGRGNYSLGIKEQLVFPEVSYDDIDKIRGFDIILVTSANTDNEAHALLTEIGMPIKKRG